MKKVTFVFGHYGSGKSEFCINVGIKTNIDYLVDLDIINPYFRSREVFETLKNNNIEVISSSVKDSLGSDLPYISKDVFLPIINKSKVIYDLGGEVGAKLLRQFSDINLEDCEMLLVCNLYREETSSVKSIIDTINRIESYSGVKITGLVNNTNLIKETTSNDIIYGQKILEEVSKILNVKIKYTCLSKHLKKQDEYLGEVIIMNGYLRKEWM